MAIKRVEINDFIVFKGEFTADFFPGVNVIIGSNGTGKTTLLKTMYGLLNEKIERCFYVSNIKESVLFGNGMTRLVLDNDTVFEVRQGEYNEKAGSMVHPLTGKIENIGAGSARQSIQGENNNTQSIFIPEKDMLSHSIGFLALKHERPSIPFDDTLTDIIAKAQLYPKRETLDNPICAKIRTIIGGEVAYDKDMFIVLKDNNSEEVPFSQEASGYKKFGLLWKLVRNGLLGSGNVLFWDEPENSLNPELVPILVDILLELSRNGVQIIIATHSEILASYFAVNRQEGDNVTFTSLFKDGDRIRASVSDRFDLLEPNNLVTESVKLYEKEIVKGLSNNG